MPTNVTERRPGHGPILLRDRTSIDRRQGSDEFWRETTYEMRLRFEAIPFRREMMTNTITTNRTPETTRIIVGSIEAHSLHVHGTLYGCRSAASPQHLGSKKVERQFWIQDHV